MTAAKSSSRFWVCALVPLLLGGAALLGVLPNLRAGGARPPTADEVRELQAKFQSERDSLVKSGADKRFLPQLLTNAEGIGQRASAALAGGRLLQAAEGFRQARWQLPYNPPEIPEHTARVFGNLRLRHAGEINSVAFSPDGQLLASAGRDRTVRVWDLANGHEAIRYRKHGDNVRAVAFSPDGKLIASGGDKDVRLWEPRTGKDVRALVGQGRYITSIAFSPDGKFLAAGSDDRAVRIYDVASGELRRDINDFGQMVLSVGFSPDGATLGAGVGNGQLRLWEFPKAVEPGRNQPEYWAKQDDNGGSHFIVFSPDSKRLVRCGPDKLKIYAVQPPGSPIIVTTPQRVIDHPKVDPKKIHWFTCAVFGKDGKTLYTGGTDSLIRSWDIDTGLPVGTFKGHNDEIRSLAFNAAGNQLASASSDYTVRLWHFDIVLQARDYTGHDGAVWTAVFSPDGNRIVSASADKTVRIWETASGKVLHTLAGHTVAVTTAAFSPDGKTVLSGSGDKTLRLWDADSGKPLRTLEGHQGTITTADFSPDGKRIVSGGADKLIKVWDEAGKELLSLDGKDVVAAVAFSPDGKQIAAGTVDQIVRLYDATSGKFVREWVAHQAAVSGLAFSPDGKMLATCGADQLARIWRLDFPGSEPITVSGHNGPLSSVAFRRDSKLLASAGADGVVKLWRLDGATAKEAQNFRGHRDWVSSAAFSKDGFYVVSASVDRTIKVWEVTSKEQALLAEHTGSVDAIAISPDGKLIASGATDRTVKLWDAIKGVEVLTLTGHTQGVIALAFSPDGKTLVSSGSDHEIRLWDVKAGREFPRLDGHTENLSHLIKPARVVQVTPDNKRLLSWVPENERRSILSAFDLASGKQLVTFSDSGRDAQAVAFTPDGKQAAVGARDGSVRIYDMETKQIQAGGDWFVFDKGGISALAFSADKAILVAGGDNAEVKICSVGKKETLHTLKGHTQRIVACAISPDGKHVATAGQDNLVKVWATGSGKEVRQYSIRLPLLERGGAVVQLVFTPDGRHLLTANANTTLYMLELP